MNRKCHLECMFNTFLMIAIQWNCSFVFWCCTAKEQCKIIEHTLYFNSIRFTSEMSTKQVNYNLNICKSNTIYSAFIWNYIQILWNIAAAWVKVHLLYVCIIKFYLCVDLSSFTINQCGLNSNYICQEMLNRLLRARRPHVIEYWIHASFMVLILPRSSNLRIYLRRNSIVLPPKLIATISFESVGFVRCSR